MRRAFVLLLFILCFALSTLVARAHSMYQAVVLLDFHSGALDAEVQLPLARLETAVGIQLRQQDLEQQRGRVTAYLLSGISASLPDGRGFQVKTTSAPTLVSIEGAPYVVTHIRLVAPAGANIDLFDFHCGALVDHIPSQVILVSTRTDWRTSTFANDPELLGVLRQSEQTLRVDRRAATWWSGFASVFKLGMRHIAEGTDHLLFLLVLLLPAPLRVTRGRWAGCARINQCLLQIGKVVTAFTLGHSVTLALGAMGVVHVPSRPIETLIAVSILVSAIHAYRPIFPGKEALIAASFGFVHGLAFATTLAELGLSRWERLAGIFAFNLGIEVMQLLVVMAALPSLIMLGRTLLYPPIRAGGAIFAGGIAVGWIVQRLWDLPNPADSVMETLAQHAGWIAVGLALLAIVAWRTDLLQRGHIRESVGTLIANTEEVTHV